MPGLQVLLPLMVLMRDLPFVLEGSALEGFSEVLFLLPFVLLRATEFTQLL